MARLGLFRDLFFDNEVEVEDMPLGAFILNPTTAPDGSFNAAGMAYLLALFDDTSSDSAEPPAKFSRTRTAFKDPKSTAWWSDYVVDSTETYRDRHHKHGACHCPLPFLFIYY